LPDRLRHDGPLTSFGLLFFLLDSLSAVLLGNILVYFLLILFILVSQHQQVRLASWLRLIALDRLAIHRPFVVGRILHVLKELVPNLLILGVLLTACIERVLNIRCLRGDHVAGEILRIELAVTLV
jgi:hypothetical protein